MHNNLISVSGQSELFSQESKLLESLDNSTGMYPIQLSQAEVHLIDLDENLSGKQLGQYEIISELGRGSAGRVFLAWHKHLHRHCALKIMSPNANFTKDQLVEQFKSEGQATASLVHQHIVTTHFLGHIEGYHFMEMEFLPGGSLAQFLADKHHASPVKGLYWCNQIAKALGFAHSRGILHRDLKPSNIFLTADHSIKVGDFGLACKIEDSKHQLHQIAGTPGYIAPELFLGQPPTPASDIYSLGITLFTLLTGQRPFEGRTLEELSLQLRGEPLPKIVTFCPDLPLEIVSCLDKLTADNPAERPENGMAAALLIESVLGKTRDMNLLMQEAFYLQHQVEWSADEHGYQIVVSLPNGRTQKVTLIAKDTLHHQAVVQIYSICGPDNPSFHQAALKLNSELAHGAIGLIESEGAQHLIVQNTYPRGTVDPEEIRESVMEIALHADRMEKMLTGLDQH